MLAVVPFLILATAYILGSALRLAENPGDKLMPAPEAIGHAWTRMAFSPDPRSGEIIFWQDTFASLGRMGAGLAIATGASLFAGMTIGMLPYARAAFGPLVTTLSMVPALSVLPILFILFGVGELSKVMLIIIGVLPFMVRDLSQRVAEIPEEQIIKAQTMGASTAQIALRVVLPQILPRLIDAVRLSLGPAWLFLISAEAISATSGLGYRVFLVRRYLAMDIILPYVAWITLLAISLDYALRVLRRRRFPWVDAEGSA